MGSPVAGLMICSGFALLRASKIGDSSDVGAEYLLKVPVEVTGTCIVCCDREGLPAVSAGQNSRSSSNSNPLHASYLNFASPGYAWFNEGEVETGRWMYDIPLS